MAFVLSSLQLVSVLTVQDRGGPLGHPVRVGLWDAQAVLADQKADDTLVHLPRQIQMVQQLQKSAQRAEPLSGSTSCSQSTTYLEPVCQLLQSARMAVEEELPHMRLHSVN